MSPVNISPFGSTPVCNPAASQYVAAPNETSGVAYLADDVALAARLTPQAWGDGVLVAGLNIVPATQYLVQTDCGAPGTPSLSEPASIEMQLWGDVAGINIAGIWQPPDGKIDILDMTALVSGFSHLASTPPVSILDSLGCLPDQSIDMIDVIASVDGFRGRMYPEATLCPTPCAAASETD